ncbi:hypothetical protein N7520_000606 [Penicillium odoratum]|uniref:uncharacterized protein n=1 Tax=Penicillium odoratum TaxID=1167516 RepID=UPI0025476540|nr:uncharacterized protein N7520_000606 [Penicillium odoratum]KAJ5777360.1 hypothetical protein N7520_000606 [Penicillium odoratum]
MSTEISLPILAGQTGPGTDGAYNQASSCSQPFQLAKATATVPPYVDNDNFRFKHNREELCLQFTSDWNRTQTMNTDSSMWAMYFPPSLKLQSDCEMEARLAKDLCDWPSLQTIDTPLAKLGVQAARLCAFQSPLSYERRTLLHQHITWIFYMDQVSERLALYNLHATAGSAYLENLKSILRDNPVTDMEVFRGSCPDALIDNALNAQRILADDLMPLKKKLLSPHHMSLCIDALDLYFDTQDEEGRRFCAEQTLKDIYQTRAFTVGIMVPIILCLTCEQAELFTPEDPCMIQVSVMAALWNDMIGLFKDLDSIDNKDDGSAYMNFVRVSMREQGLTAKEALRACGQRLNTLIHDYEFYLSSYRPLRRQLYHAGLEFAFMYFDFHLMGLKERPSTRYGWKIIR